MNAPRIRVEEAETDFERELLGSWGLDGPSSRARKRALAIATGSSVLLATTAKATTGATFGLRAGAKTGLAAFAKWVAVGAVGAGIVAAATSTVWTAPPEAPVAAPLRSGSRPARVSHPLAAGAERVAEATAMLEPAVAPAIDVPSSPGVAKSKPREKESSDTTARVVDPESPPAATGVAAYPPLGNGSATDPTGNDTGSSGALPPPGGEGARASRELGEQVALVDRARAALGAGQYAGALRALTDYDSRFAAGILSQEATVLRIEALSRSGDRNGAAEVARRFLARHPTSPYVTKIRRLVALEPNP